MKESFNYISHNFYYYNLIGNNLFMKNNFIKYSTKFFVLILSFLYISYSLSEDSLLNKCRQTVGKVAKNSLTVQTNTRPVVRSHPKEVPSFNIPKSTRESELYKSKGYEESAYRGIDEIIYYGILGAKLKEEGVDSHRTHIEDLARLVHVRLNWFGEVLAAAKIYIEPRLTIGQSLSSFRLFRLGRVTRRLDEEFEIFDVFVKEAQERVHQRAVTYRWFTIWNHRLTMLASIVEFDGNRLLRRKMWMTHEGFEKLFHLRPGLIRDERNYFFNDLGLKDLKDAMDNFPYEIVFYIPGEMGIIALNYAEPSGIPIGLLNDNPSDFYSTNRKMTDGVFMSPVRYAAHDLRHHREGFGKQRWFKNVTAPISKAEFKKRFIDKVRQMPQEQGYQAHLGFFLFNHELRKTQNVDIQNREDILRMILSYLDAFHDQAIGLLPGHIIRNLRKSNLENYLRQVAGVFSDVIDQIIEETAEKNSTLEMVQ